MSQTSTRDVIIVGGGHNGLACGAYLAKTGLDVLVLEARDTVGGCASTVDALGARVNVCNCDHSLVRATGVIEDLELFSHGLEYLDMEPAQLMLPWDGSPPWMLFHDVDKTLQSLALTRPRQVAGYQRYLDDLLPAARLVLAMTAGPPTAKAVAGRLARMRGKGLKALMRLSRTPAADILADYFDDDALIAGAATTGPAVWGLAPTAPGTGLGALSYALRHVIPVGRPVGGSGALTDALAKAVTAYGGTVRTAAAVAEIRCKVGHVSGVTLETGERIDARTVIAAGDPRAALVDLLADPPPAARRLVDRWHSQRVVDGYESKIDAVIDVLPQPKRIDDRHLEVLGVSEPFIGTAIVTPSVSGLSGAANACRTGRIATHPPMLANVPSLLDPSFKTDDGGHIFSLEVLFTPYSLHGGWDQSAEPERWLRAFAERVEPGFLEGVRRWRVVTPPDYEHDFAMPRGYAPSFAGGPLAALAGRQPELTRYKTPVPGLFLTGAGTFPGAGVSGAPGRNAAGVVLDELYGG